MEQPLISVVICTYNGEEYLRETIESVIAQTYTNMEIVIVDDGSTDGTASIIRELAQKHQKIRPFFKPNGGLPMARNHAFERALGDWVAVIDQDDLCYPTRLARQFEVACENPSAELVFCDTHFIDERGKILGHHFSKFTLPDRFIPKILAGNLLLRIGCYVDSEAWFMRRDAISKIGMLDGTLSYACDYEYFIRAGFAVDFAYTKEILCAWRIHGTQATATAPKIRQQVRGVYRRFFWEPEVNWWTRVLIMKTLMRSYLGQWRDAVLRRTA